jgi:hypothetical protein
LNDILGDFDDEDEKINDDCDDDDNSSDDDGDDDEREEKGNFDYDVEDLLDEFIEEEVE